MRLNGFNKVWSFVLILFYFGISSVAIHRAMEMFLHTPLWYYINLCKWHSLCCIEACLNVIGTYFNFIQIKHISNFLRNILKWKRNFNHDYSSNSAFIVNERHFLWKFPNSVTVYDCYNLRILHLCKTHKIVSVTLESYSFLFMSFIYLSSLQSYNFLFVFALAMVTFTSLPQTKQIICELLH